jgi:hypothetical protein
MLLHVILGVSRPLLIWLGSTLTVRIGVFVFLVVACQAHFLRMQLKVTLALAWEQLAKTLTLTASERIILATDIML